jgi:poly(hydroxyalkanoate) granule-associated protein
MGSKRKAKETATFDPYHIWLAGLGAAARSEEEGSALFAELAEKGRGVVAASGKKARKRMQDVGEQLRDWVQTAGQDVSSWFGRTFDAAARSAGVPKADDVAELMRRLEELASRLEKVERGRRPKPTAPRPATKAAAAAERVEVRVVYADDAWQVRLGGDETPTSSHPTKVAAVTAARALADARSPALLVLHTKAGAVQSRGRVG